MLKGNLTVETDKLQGRKRLGDDEDGGRRDHGGNREPSPQWGHSAGEKIEENREKVETLEKKVSQVYRLYGKPENFRSVVWKNTGHEYLPEMRERMIAAAQAHATAIDGVIVAAGLDRPGEGWPDHR